MRIRKSRKQKICFKKDDETLKKYLSSDILPKSALKTRFCPSDTNEKGEVKPLPFRLVTELNGWEVAL